jgi:ribonuclease R
VPVSTLGDDYYRFDEAARTLTGDTTGTVYAAGQTMQLRLAEASPISGALRFELPDGGSNGGATQRKLHRPVMGKRGRPGNIRHQGRRR